VYMAITSRLKPSDCSLDFSATTSEEGAAIDDKELPEFHCDACSNDTTNTVRIRCADRNCPDFDLCVICFYRGAEPVKYKVWHDY
jgi:transcriptional adapter 2-alpha